jgi:hypothetical protein
MLGTGGEEAFYLAMFFSFTAFFMVLVGVVAFLV